MNFRRNNLKLIIDIVERLEPPNFLGLGGWGLNSQVPLLHSFWKVVCSLHTQVKDEFLLRKLEKFLQL